MKLNVDKCKLMCVGRQNPTSSSTLLHFKLTGTTQGKGPGVIVNSSMKTSVTSTAAGSKANTTLPVQGTFQIVIGVMEMWQGTGTACQLLREQGEERHPGTSHPEQHPWIEDILPSGSLGYQGSPELQLFVGCGFPGQNDGQITNHKSQCSPAQHTEPQTVHMAKSSWTFVGGSLFIGSKSQKILRWPCSECARGWGFSQWLAEQGV